MVGSSKKSQEKTKGPGVTVSLEPGQKTKTRIWPEEEEEADHEILFPSRNREIIVTPLSPGRVLEVPDCDVAIMVKTLNGAIAAVSQDTARIQRAYRQLCTDNLARDKALADITAMIKEYGSSPRPYGSPTPTGGPRPVIVSK